MGKVGELSSGAWQPIVGCNIQLCGSEKMAVSDLDGYYVIHGIPKGIYSISFSIRGYENKRVDWVRIRGDLTTERADTLLRARLQSLP